MVEQNIASYKTIFYIVCICILYLALMFIRSKANNSTRLYICADKEHSERIIQRKDFTILLSPKNSKTVLECAGRAMPFYDRTIDIVQGAIPQSVRKTLENRYIINQLAPMQKVDTAQMSVIEVILHQEEYSGSL